MVGIRPNGYLNFFSPHYIDEAIIKDVATIEEAGKIFRTDPGLSMYPSSMLNP